VDRLDQHSTSSKGAEEAGSNMLAPGRRGKKNDHGKESVQKTEVTTGKRTSTRACKKACTKESDSWRKNWRKNNMRMGEKPNVRRVRVLVIFCKWLKSPKCINIDTKVSYRGVCWFVVIVVVVVVIVDFMLVFMKITIVIE
jgi:hypothetical protein